MKELRIIRVLLIVTTACFLGLMPAYGETISQLEERVAAANSPLEAKEALAEAYLKQCDLEKSLRLWREILAADPEHKRAKFAVARLTMQALDLDSHLEVVETLIEKGQTAGMDSLLEAAGLRAATDSQKSRILCLRGQLYGLKKG